MNVKRPFAAHTSAAIFAVLSLSATAYANSLRVTSIDPGYIARSVELGVPFGGAVATDPADADILYVSAGSYSMHTIVQVHLGTGTTRTVTPLVGNVGGLAVLSNGDLAITDNFSSETILRAHDINADGDWLDNGEITELITPILDDGDFTGAQLAVAPPGNAAGIPANSLVLQTADGGSSAELLVIENPETNPGYYPVDTAWFAGFSYNGGIAFSPEGNVICGVSEYPAGRISVLVNLNNNGKIESGESRDIVGASTLVNSIADLGVTGDGRMVTTENSGTVRMFQLPADLLAGTATGGVLAETNGTYLSCARVDFPNRSFAPFDPATNPDSTDKATVYIGGFVTFPAATNLLAITPRQYPASANGWELYE